MLATLTLRPVRFDQSILNQWYHSTEELQGIYVLTTPSSTDSSSKAAAINAFVYASRG